MIPFRELWSEFTPFLSSRTHLNLTTPLSNSFAAPEVLKGARYGGKETDVWALGVLGYVITIGESLKHLYCFE